MFRGWCIVALVNVSHVKLQRDYMGGIGKGRVLAPQCTRGLLDVAIDSLSKLTKVLPGKITL
jgi:hypothetical protein